MIKHFMLIFLIAFTLLAQDLELRVMTYNIRYANNNAGEEWSERKNKVFTIIDFCRPDVFTVQEALKEQIDDLLIYFKDYKYAGVGRDDGKESGEYSAIFYDLNKFSVTEDGTFWLSETPEKPSKSWDAALPRIATWAAFNDKSTGKQFYIFNTHFDHVGIEARGKSAGLILHRINSKTGSLPVILTGDFNSRDTSAAYKTLTKADGLFDSRTLSMTGLYGSTMTFNGFGKSLVDDNTIDYIFVSKRIGVKNHFTLGEKIDGFYASDHMPVIADIIID